MKREAALKSAFTRELKRRFPRFVVLLLATGGAPDRLIVGNGHATFWEMKHATPAFKSTGLQELTACRLAEQGYCRYVLWWENRHGDAQTTMIVHPRVVHERTSWVLEAEAVCEGFDQAWLVTQVGRAHGLG
jgi:hypothetical protein